MFLSFRPFQSFYHRIRTTMSLDPLPAPPVVNAAMRKLFPVSDDNRERQKARMLSRMPFVVHTSSTIIQDMIDCGDACAAVRITKVQHYQREVAPLHEFIIVWYHVVNKPEVANYLVIERWGSDVQPPNPTKEKVDKLDIYTGDPAPSSLGSGQMQGPVTATTASSMNNSTSSAQTQAPIAATTPSATDYPASSSTTYEGVPFSEQLRHTAKGSLRHSLELSGKLTTSVASDRIVVSCRRNDIDLEKMEPGDRTLLATLILCIASFVSQHSAIYDLFDKSCFYYSRAIFDITRCLMKCEGTQIKVAQGFDFFKLDALKWGATIFNGAMADQTNVRAQKESIDRPVKVLEQQLRDEARARAAFEEELRQLRALLDTQASGPSSRRTRNSASIGTSWRSNRPSFAICSLHLDDLQDLPQPSQQDKFDGCLPFSNENALPFLVIPSLVRLGRKYDFANLLNAAVERLTFENPATLTEYDVLLIFSMASLVADVPPRGDGTSATLIPVDQRSCVLGRPRLVKVQFELDYTFGWLQTAASPEGECQELQQTKKLSVASVVTHWETITSVWVGVWVGIAGWWSVQGNAMGRQKLWEELPGLFDLPSWTDFK
ncbi:hypothetical protein B0H14DRAFT_2599481 [Mycena olivaceomarginata]|nr:hypothetical protein B0H14DRAFT_2599481 [Mycena olivaceomarginata]